MITIFNKESVSFFIGGQVFIVLNYVNVLNHIYMSNNLSHANTFPVCSWNAIQISFASIPTAKTDVAAESTLTCYAVADTGIEYCQPRHCLTAQQIEAEEYKLDQFSSRSEMPTNRAQRQWLSGQRRPIVFSWSRLAAALPALSRAMSIF